MKALTPTAARVAANPALMAACRDPIVAYGSGEAEVVALDRVDMSLFRDETVALWGPSGSGKSTLLHALGGLVEPTDGVVRWQGALLSSLDTSARARARAEGIAYVFQGSNLLPCFTAPGCAGAPANGCELVVGLGDKRERAQAPHEAGARLYDSITPG